MIVIEAVRTGCWNAITGRRQVISGRLNQVIRLLLAEQTIEYTIPDKPNSRLQKYRLTETGAAHLGALRKGDLSR